MFKAKQCKEEVKHDTIGVKHQVLRIFTGICGWQLLKFKFANLDIISQQPGGVPQKLQDGWRVVNLILN